MNQRRFRLGAVRRNVRDYPVKLRRFGLNSKQRNHLDSLKQIILLRSYCLAEQYDELTDSLLPMWWLAHKQGDYAKKNLLRQMIQMHEDDTEIIEMAYLFTSKQYNNLVIPCLEEPDPIHSKNIDFDSFSDQEFYADIGFSRDQCICLFNLLDLPEQIVLNKHSKRHRFKVSSVHAFLYMLFHYRTPSARLTIDEVRWGYDYSVLSKIFKTMVKLIDKKHRHRLQRLSPYVLEKLPMFNAKIVGKLQKLYPNEALPQHATGCAMFVDGTRFETSRPAGEYWRQRAVYSGDYKMHCHGAQSTFGPDGIIYDWHDSPFGRFNDKHFIADSGVNERMRLMQIHKLIQYWIYGDKGYDNMSHVRCAYHGPYVTPAENGDNYKMSRGGRSCIEWGFNKVKANCPLIKRKQTLKYQAMDVSATVRVAVILTNAHTCMNGSATGRYFKCNPPTVNEYFEP